MGTAFGARAPAERRTTPLVKSAALALGLLGARAGEPLAGTAAAGSGTPAHWTGCNPASHRGNHSDADHGGVPKKIWSFWSDPDPARLPKICQLAKASWQAYASDYDIHLLHAENWNEFLTDAQIHRGNGPGEGITATTRDNRFADWLRSVLLAEIGGVWIDASIVLTAPLELLIHPDAQISGVHLSGMLFETSFIAAAHGSRTMRRWRDEFERICSLSDGDYEAYLLRLKLNGIEALNGQFNDCGWASRSSLHAAAYWIYDRAVHFVNWLTPISFFEVHPCGEWYWMRYLNLHVALNSVLGTEAADPEKRWEYHGVCVQDSGETLSKVSSQVGWDGQRAASYLMTRASKDYDLTAARGIKLRKEERKAVEDVNACEEGSAICRIQDQVNFHVFPKRPGVGHEL